jgi:hypothetical protein
MNNGTLDIQAALRAKYAELCSRQRDMEHALKSVEDEMVRVSVALDALASETAPAENVGETNSPNVAEKVPLTGGGPGGFGSPGAEIKLGVPKPPAAKKRTPKRARG